MIIINNITYIDVISKLKKTEYHVKTKLFKFLIGLYVTLV